MLPLSPDELQPDECRIAVCTKTFAMVCPTDRSAPASQWTHGPEARRVQRRRVHCLNCKTWNWAAARQGKASTDKENVFSWLLRMQQQGKYTELCKHIIVFEALIAITIHRVVLSISGNLWCPTCLHLECEFAHLQASICFIQQSKRFLNGRQGPAHKGSPEACQPTMQTWTHPAPQLTSFATMH
eukprot:1157539-Pelagomonas_calceolata.AAC.4